MSNLSLTAGMVGINTGMISDPVAPFGGIKQSGFGREGGSTGIEEFQNVKVSISNSVCSESSSAGLWPGVGSEYSSVTGI